MEGTCEQLVAVVCDDRPSFRDAVVRLLSACGYEVRAVTDDWGAVVPLVHEHGADVAVVALPLAGMSGLLAVRDVVSAAPDCELVLVSPATSLLHAAVEAGARALVPETDLRGLRQVLLEVAAAPARPQRAEAQADSSGSVRQKPSA